MSHLVNLTEIAKRLNVLPNQVWVWHNRRARNNFPEAKAHGRSANARGGPKAGPLFDMEEVYLWYVNYVPSKGGAPRKNSNGFRRGNYMGRVRSNDGQR